MRTPAINSRRVKSWAYKLVAMLLKMFGWFATVVFLYQASEAIIGDEPIWVLSGWAYIWPIYALIGFLYAVAILFTDKVNLPFVRDLFHPVLVILRLVE